MFILARTVVYATLFIGFLLVFLPGRILARSGVASPPPLGVLQLVGAATTTAGALLAVACILTFAANLRVFDADTNAGSCPS